MFLPIFSLFLVCMSFSFIETRLKERDKIILYALIGVGMILIAGTRGIYDTPDSDNYEILYYGTVSWDDDFREPTFIIMSYFLKSLGLGINALFFAYAIMSIPLRLGIIWKMSKFPLITLGVYFSHYYQLHDLMQIRCAVASALFLFALYYRVEKKNLYTFLFLILGVLFHYSAAFGFLLFFLDNDRLSKWQLAILYSVIPIGLIVYFMGVDIFYLIPDNFGGDRLSTYRRLKEAGLEDEYASWAFYVNPVVITNILLYFVVLYFHKILTDKYKYTPIMLKIMCVAFACMLMLGNFSAVLANRLNEYFEIVAIFLWTATIYLFYPIFWGKITVNLISTLRCVACILIYTIGTINNH